MKKNIADLTNDEITHAIRKYSGKEDLDPLSSDNDAMSLLDPSKVDELAFDRSLNEWYAKVTITFGVYSSVFHKSRNHAIALAYLCMFAEQRIINL